MHAAAHMERVTRIGILALALVFGIGHLRAESPGDAGQAYDSAALRDLVGPVALYPDDLLAIVLPASTYPVQIVQAARYLDQYNQNQDLTPNDSWDDSIVALLNYPEVIDLLNADLDWTWRLGDAVLNQQADVLRAIQQFRDRAYAAGNLNSDDRQVVRYVDDAIEIRPVEKEIIYVPYYQPERVIVYQSAPAYYYYPSPYPVYYYPYPAGYSFRSGYFWGITTAFAVGWDTHRLRVRHHRFRTHPYYGYQYQSSFTVRRHRDFNRRVWRGNADHDASGRFRSSDSWRPGRRHGARPFRGGTTERRHRVKAANERAELRQGRTERRRGEHARDTVSRGAGRPERHAAARSPQRRDGKFTARRNLQARRATADRPSPRLAIRSTPREHRRAAAQPGQARRQQPERHGGKRAAAPTRSRVASTGPAREHRAGRGRARQSAGTATGKKQHRQR